MNSQTLSIRLAHFQAAVRTVGRIALCVAALIVAIAQQSSVAAETSSAKVSLAGLDLSTPEGLGIARDRLHDAVRLACSRVADSRDLAHQPNFVKCVEDTQARAMQQVKKPALSEVEQSGTALRSTEANNGSNRVSGAATLAAKVSLFDLDLETPEGAHAAVERLHETARLLCSRVADSRDLGHQPHFVACVDEAMAAALRQISGPALAAITQSGNSAGVSGP